MTPIPLLDSTPGASSGHASDLATERLAGDPVADRSGRRAARRGGLGLALGLGLGPCVGLLLALASSIASGDTSAAASSQARTVSAFHAVDLAGTLEVEVTLGKPASVAVTGDADLLDKVVTVVKDGVLVISTPQLRHERHRGNIHLRAIVTAPDLSALALSGTGTIKLAGIANERLAIDLSGTGQVVASGETGALHVDVGGTGEVVAKALSAKDVKVEVGGTGSASLHASRSLEAQVSGTGSIHVAGHPTQVKKSVSGLGSIHVD